MTEKELEKDKSDSATWLQEINRGGLTVITQEAQQVFMAIETPTRKHLTLNKAHKMDETTRCSRGGQYTDYLVISQYEFGND